MSPLILEPELTGDSPEAIEMQLTLDAEVSWEPLTTDEPARGEDVALGGQDTAAATAGLGGESSLDAVLSRMWEGLAAHQSVECPMCAGEMLPVYGAHPRPIAARCGRCETSLS